MSWSLIFLIEEKPGVVDHPKRNLEDANYNYLDPKGKMLYEYFDFFFILDIKFQHIVI